MNNYEIKKQNRAFIKPFADYTSAEAWAVGYFTDGFVITDLGEIPALTLEEKAVLKIKKGEEVLSMYLLENDAIAANRGYPFTIEETIQQIQMFQVKVNGEVVTTLQELLKLGSIVQSLQVLQNVVPNEIFTEERKIFYINELQSFLNTL